MSFLIFFTNCSFLTKISFAFFCLQLSKQDEFDKKIIIFEFSIFETLQTAKRKLLKSKLRCRKKTNFCQNFFGVFLFFVYKIFQRSHKLTINSLSHPISCAESYNLYLIKTAILVHEFFNFFHKLSIFNKNFFCFLLLKALQVG